MMSRTREHVLMALILVAGCVAPWLFPGFMATMALFWLMIVFSLTWDINGGQMGYNSFGNILFFGLGVYVCAVFQRDAGLGYFPSLFIGMGLGGVVALLSAAILGPIVLALRGHYFAIATLGIAVAAGDIFAGWEYVGAGFGHRPRRCTRARWVPAACFFTTYFLSWPC